MLLKTHLSITLFGILLLVSNVEHKIVFVLVAILATYIPDIDSRYSTIGKRKINRVLQFFTKHRGFIHSFVFLIMLTGLIVLIFPIISLGFFLGYSLHLFADSFTKDGIQPFYPFSKKRVKGRIATGGKAEISLLVVFVIIDLFLLAGLIFF